MLSSGVRGHQYRITHREALEPEILLERDGSSDACESSQRLR